MTPLPNRAARTGAHRESYAPGRRPALDGIRAFAILTVFVSHAVPHTGAGWLGVEVFFALSGYLITGLLLREQERTGGIALGKFYMRRALRLYPALIVLLAVGVIFAAVLGDGGTLAGYGRTVAAAGLYVQDFVWGFSGAHGGYGHTWSLAIEEQFYLLWPLAVLFLHRRRIVFRVALGLGIACLAGTAIFEIVQVVSADLPGDPPGAYFLPWVQAPLLFAGCALAAKAPHVERAKAARMAVAGAIVLVLTLVVAELIKRADHLALLLTVAAAAAVALICGVEAAPDAPIARLLAWGPIEYLGRISYGWYLYHLPVIEVVEHYFHGPLAVAVVIEFGLTTGCSLLSYYMVETPFYRLKDRFQAVSAATASTSMANPRLDKSAKFSGRSPD